MRAVLSLIGLLFLPTVAAAQVTTNLTDPTYLAVNSTTVVGSGVGGPNGYFVTTGQGIPLGYFATQSSIDALGARVDHAFQQFQQSNNTQLERGIAAAVALQGVSMPSAPGRTTWAINGAAFQSQIGGGISLAHRLSLNTPLAITGAYGNGGGTTHVGRVGLMGEF